MNRTAPATPSRNIRNYAPEGEAGFPATNRKIAERKLREWIARLEGSQSPADCVLTLGKLLDRYTASKAGDSDSTKTNAG